MDRVGYSEYVGVGDASAPPGEIPASPTEHVVTYCDLEAVNRCKEEVRFGPGLAPSAFRTSIICYEECSRRKFISRVEYSPRQVPRRFATTCYVRPRHLVRSCATFLELPSPEENKGNWFKSSVSLEPRTFSSCKVQGSLEFTKIVEEKRVAKDGSVKIHIENYKNGELINVSDVRKHVIGADEDDVTTNMAASTDSDVTTTNMRDAPTAMKSNSRIQEALETLKPKENGFEGSPVEDLIWMDGFMDKDCNIIALRPEDSPDLFYQADDEENEILTDDNANVTHHLKKRRSRRAMAAHLEENNNENNSELEGDWYQSGPFVYGVPRRPHRSPRNTEGSKTGEQQGVVTFRHFNGVSK